MPFLLGSSLQLHTMNPIPTTIKEIPEPSTDQFPRGEAFRRDNRDREGEPVGQRVVETER